MNKQTKEAIKVLEQAGIQTIRAKLTNDASIFFNDEETIEYQLLHIRKLISSNVSGCEGCANDRDTMWLYWWAGHILSTLFSKLPKGFFRTDIYRTKRNWNFKDKVKAFIFRKLL